MKKLVLDSSVFVKIFGEGEADSDAANSLLEKIIDDDIEVVLPRLFYYEVLGVARKSKVAMDEVIAVLRDYEASCFTYIPESETLTRKAVEISLAGNDKSGYPSFYDASYHALAISENCQFITADRRHVEKTKPFGHVMLLSDLRL